MAVTVYVFDALRNVRRIATEGIGTLIHDERNYTLNAGMNPEYQIKNGEYLGFNCVDGRFRIFRVDKAETDALSTTITGTDEAVSRLVGTAVGNVQMTGATATQTMGAILDGRGWTLGEDASGGKTADIQTGYSTAWKAITDAAEAYNLRAAPHYELAGRTIGKKILDLVSKETAYRGRFIEHGVDGDGIVVSFVDVPRPRIVAYGAQQEDGTRLTIAGAAWSKAKGDPADKPAGQLYISDPEAEALYGDDEQILDRSDISDEDELISAAWEAAQKVRERKIRASATVADMEMIAGQTHKALRLWDSVIVRTRYGDVKAQVIEIKRNYVRPDQTKITIGEEAESGAKRIASLTRSTRNLAGQIKEQSRKVQENSDRILLKASLTEVRELEKWTKTETSNIWLDLNAKAGKAELAATNELIAENDTYYTRLLTEVGLKLDAKAGVAELSAVKSQIEGTQTDVNGALLRLDAAESSILLKADVVYVDAEITKARTVLAEEIEAAKSEVQLDISSQVVTNLLTVNTAASFYGNVDIRTLTLGGHHVNRTGITVVTGISGGGVSSTNTALLTTEVGAVRTIEAGSADPVYKNGMQARHIQGEEYTGFLFSQGTTETVKLQGDLFMGSLFYDGGEETVTLQGPQYYGAYEDGGEEYVTLQGSAYTQGTLYVSTGGTYRPVGRTLYEAGSGRTFHKRGSGISEPLYRAGEKKTFHKRGEDYPGALYEPGKSREIKIQGDMLTVPLFYEGEEYAGGLYTNFAPTIITVQDVTALTS